MNRVAVMSFPDALRKKPFQETDWRFLGIALIFLILLSMLVILGDRTLDFPEPVLSEDTAAFYVDLILEAEKEGTPVKAVEVETDLVEGGTGDVDKVPPEPAEKTAEPEPLVDTVRRGRAARTERKKAVGTRIAEAKEAQTAALESSGILAMLTVAAPTGGGRGPGGEPGTSAGPMGVFSVADVGEDFTTSADLSKDRRVTGYVKASKQEIKAQMAKAKELEATMTRAELEAVEALANAQFEVKLSGLSKVEEIARTMPGRDPEAIEAMITRYRAQIAYCYETELRKNSGLKGRIVVRFTVRPNGRVTGVRVVQSTMGNRKVESCIVRVLRTFRFEVVGRERGNLTYEYPFIFVPG